MAVRVDPGVAPPSTRTRRRLRARPTSFGVATGVLTLLLVIGVVYPIVKMIQALLFNHGTFESDLISQTLTSADFLHALKDTAIVVAISNVIAIPLGTLLAWLTERTDARMGSLSRLLPVIPLLLPPIALSIGWVFLGDPRSGYGVNYIKSAFSGMGVNTQSWNFGVNGWVGLVFVYVLVLVPHVYVIVAAAYRSLDPSLEEAARLAKGSVFRCFYRVSVPSVQNAIASAGLLSIILSIGLYSVPQVLGVPANISVLSTYIFNLINGQYPSKTNQAVVIGLAMIVVIGLAWMLQQRFVRGARHAQMTGMGVRSARIPLGRLRWVARAGIIVYVLVTSVLPMLALIIVALQTYWQPKIIWSRLSITNFTTYLTNADFDTALRNSVILALVVSTITVVAGSVLAVYAAQARGRSGTIVGVVTKVPAAIPHIAFAVGILVAFGAAPFFLSGSLWILFICFVIIFFPTASIAAEAAVSQIGNDLSDASLISGAGRGRTFGRVQLPLSASGLAAGWAIVFTLAIGELNSAAILSGPSNPVIGYKIISVFGEGTFSQLAALATVIVVISVVLVGGALLFARPRFDVGEG